MGEGITLAMIARNEAEKIGRCLESVRDAVDEIVLVDTGSSDDTREIALRCGAGVHDLPWPGRFDAARNASLDLVKTEWVLWLDADEWLVEGAASSIRQAIQHEEASAFLLVRRDLLGGDAYSEQHLLRVWRHDPGLRFQGVIHEQISLERLKTLNPGRNITPTNIPFWHDGFAPELSRQKAERNLPLLVKEAGQRTDTLYFEIELLQTLKLLHDPRADGMEEDLADRILAMHDQDEAPDNTLALFFMRHFADLNGVALKTDRTHALLRMARGWFPNHPGVRYLCAQVEIKNRNLQSALADLLALEQMAETGSYDRLTSTNPIVLGEGLSTNLALVAQQLGRRDLANKHLNRLQSIQGRAGAEK
jgi:glycosyltransferase involved in cell wall biosynthesis